MGKDSFVPTGLKWTLTLKQLLELCEEYRASQVKDLMLMAHEK